MKFYPKMYYIYVPVILDGIISGFISVYFSKLIFSGIRTDLNVGYLLMIEGVGCIFGAMTSAHLSDKFTVYNVGRAGFILILFAIGITFANYII